MRTFVISDIHGNDEAFRRALKFVRLKKSDKLILLGDYIDRGFNSKGVLDTILLLKQHSFNMVCLRGNHEQMFLEAFQDVNKLNTWLLNGGKETLASFLTSSITKIPYKYLELIESFEYFHQTDQYIFVHAALNMKIPDPFSDLETILWSRNQEELLDYNWLSNRIVIHGHNPTSQDEIITSFQNDQSIKCIDNGVFVNKQGFGHLCVLQLDNLELNFIK